MLLFIGLGGGAEIGAAETLEVPITDIDGVLLLAAGFA
jgi:hypothetical protein